MSFANKSLSIIGNLGVVLLLLAAFGAGLGGVLYLALRSPEVKVPEIVGKDYNDGERDLASLDLKIRKRTDRFSTEKPNTILEQIPLPGDTVKAGQIISVVISRAQAEGDEKPAEVKKDNSTDDKDKAKDVDEPTDVDKARAKRKAANVNKNSNVNKNANGNSNANSNGNSNGNSNAASNSINNSGNANSGSVSGNSNANHGNSNARTNSNSGGNSNARPAAGNSNSSNRAIPTLTNNRNNNANRHPQ